MHVRLLLASLALALVASLPAPASASRYFDNYAWQDEAAYRVQVKVKRKARHVRRKALYAPAYTSGRLYAPAYTKGAAARRKAVQRRHVRGRLMRTGGENGAYRRSWARPAYIRAETRAAKAKKGREAVPVRDVSGLVLPELAALRRTVTAPAKFIFGRLTCSLNVNAALAARGIRGTGSALARSFLGWGHASPPVPGAVAVYGRGRRGGHVAIVAKVVRGTVYVWNPSSRRGWRLIAYNRRAIAYRVAG